jgi:hypothetical protein
MTIPSVTLLEDGDAFGGVVGDLLGVGVFVLDGVEGFFFFGVGVGVGLVVFDASAVSLDIAGNKVARTKKKILREICPINRMVSNQIFTISRKLVGAHSFGTLGWDYGSSQKSFRLVGLYKPVEPFERLNTKRSEEMR